MSKSKYHLVLDHDGVEKAYSFETRQEAEEQFETFKRDPKTFSAELYKEGARLWGILKSWERE